MTKPHVENKWYLWSTDMRAFLSHSVSTLNMSVERGDHLMKYSLTMTLPMNKTGFSE